jgi:hypothetical protein
MARRGVSIGAAAARVPPALKPPEESRGEEGPFSTEAFGGRPFGAPRCRLWTQRAVGARRRLAARQPGSRAPRVRRAGHRGPGSKAGAPAARAPAQPWRRACALAKPTLEGAPSGKGWGNRSALKKGRAPGTGARGPSGKGRSGVPARARARAQRFQRARAPPRRYARAAARRGARWGRGAAVWPALGRAGRRAAAAGSLRTDGRGKRKRNVPPPRLKAAANRANSRGPSWAVAWGEGRMGRGLWGASTVADPLPLCCAQAEGCGGRSGAGPPCLPDEGGPVVKGATAAQNGRLPLANEEGSAAGAPATPPAARARRRS